MPHLLLPESIRAPARKSSKRLQAPVRDAHEPKGKAGAASPSVDEERADQPLVMIGGGAFGDLPAQPARVSTARDANAKTRTFFITNPRLCQNGTRCLWKG